MTVLSSSFLLESSGNFQNVLPQACWMNHWGWGQADCIFRPPQDVCPGKSEGM